ncbi:lymphocyte-specific helicase-like isoform X2 [Pseudomyrmex gracilis]|uniref:lymphocyte-specific helicase-like isoform X2 n=1 Tax=Pseudomyrmex gracilis TaxID=219809 RepID=UPI0009951E7B|nr:lymphocyte-specific helicase-like isoform X2 [Pseudomyrmex gracilis]
MFNLFHLFSKKIPLAADVKFNTSASLEEVKNSQKSRKRLSEENKQLVEEQYQKELHERRYKLLMHLLNQSKFFSSYLLKKVESDMTTKKKGVSSSVNDENIPPNKKRLRRADQEKYNMQDYISTEMREVQHLGRKRKKRLCEEDIAAELHKDSDSEIRKSAHNEVLALKYFRGELRDYQKDGLKWMKVLYKNGINGILADEMGLGKTIQVIAMMCHLIEKEQSGPYLIIAPLSTIPNWVIEFERFAPDIPTILFYGSSIKRKHLYGKIKTKYTVNSYKTQPVVITSYETPLRELKFFQSQRWRYIVVDEGQRIKNHNCMLMKTLKSMQSMNKLILTGTPLQNNLAELWSLLNFLMPDIFDNLTVFESWFDVKELQHQKGTEKLLKQEEEKKVLMTLREILKPFMLRRVKADVCLEIPPKKELVVYAPLTKLQHDLYRAVLNYDLQTLSKIEEPDPIIPSIDNKRPQRKCVLRKKQKYVFEKSSNISLDSSANSSLETNKEYHDDTKREVKCKDKEDLSMWKQYTDVTERNRDFLINIKFGNRIMMYKKIVNHPYLIHCPLDAVGLPKIDVDLIKSSGKLLVLDAMLAKLNARGHKVLLFSTMTMLLDIIEDYIMLRHYKYVRLDGTVEIEKRKKDIAAFNANPDLFLFLISTRAGGIGLNLAGADTVIIYDSDWNPQVDIQAMARCHRIGQTKPIVVYRLCTKGTIDEEIIKRAEAKRVLEKAIISKQISQNKDFLLALKQLMSSKEYKVVTSENEVFTQEELDKLLDRSDMVDQMCK